MTETKTKIDKVFVDISSVGRNFPLKCTYSLLSRQP